MNKVMTDNDWPEYYRVLGEFVVNFENVVFSVRQDSTFLLKANGLKDEMIGEIIFGQKFFTADPLMSCYVTIVSHTIKRTGGNTTLIKRLDDFKKKFSKLIESRNDIVHSAHFFVESINIVGPPQTVTDFKAFKPSPKKTGYELKRTPRPQIIELSKQLKAVKKEFDLFVVDLHKHLTGKKVI